MLLPHRITLTISVGYGNEKMADAIERQIRKILGSGTVKYDLEMTSDRPPMKLRNSNRYLAKKLTNIRLHIIPLHSRWLLARAKKNPDRFTSIRGLPFFIL